MNVTFKRLAIALCCLMLPLALTACDRTARPAPESYEESGLSQEESPPPREDEEPPLEPAWYAGHYIEGISLQRMEDFASSGDILPEEYVSFFMTANYDGQDKLPIPEGYRSSEGELILPADAVEGYVTEYFDVSSDYLRTGDCYLADRGSYLLEGWGMSGQNRVEVTDVREDEEGLSLIFDVYLIMAPEGAEPVTIGPISTREALFSPNGDRFKVLSLTTLYTGDLPKLMAEAGFSMEG